MFATYRRLKQRRDAGEIEGGFTLIELLIVIVVLGILAGVVVFALGGITGKSAQAACQADGTTVNTAIAAFNAQNPGVPVTQNLLTGTPSGTVYIQSWPSNSPHYAYAIVSGTLLIEAPATTGWVASPTNGGTLATGEPYTGPSICSSPSVQ